MAIKIPEHVDFQLIFNVNKDGSTFDLTTIDRWTLAIGKNINGYPLILKDSNGVTTSGDFVVDNTAKTVAVSISSTEYDSSSHGASGGDGSYFVNLYALDSSGNQITHTHQKISIEPALVPTGEA